MNPFLGIPLAGGGARGSHLPSLWGAAGLGLGTLQAGGGPPGRWVSLAWIPRPHSVISNPPAHTGGVHFTKATQLPSALVCQPQMSSTPLRQASFSIASSLRLSLPSLRPRPSLSRGRSAPELVQRPFSSYLLAYPPLLVPLHLFLQLS